MNVKKILFVLVIIIGMGALGAYPLMNQKESNVSNLEKRELSYSKPLTISNWIAKEFQTSIENTVTDNFWRRSQLVQHYNKLNANISIVGNKIMSACLEKYLGQRIILRNINDKVSYMNEISYLVYNPLVYDEEIEKEIGKNLEKIKCLDYVNKGTSFFVYIPLVSNQNIMVDISGVSERYLNLFVESKIPVKSLQVGDVEDLKKTYFGTDHHWSHIGAYQGYTDIIKLLFGGKEKEKVPISEEILEDVNFYGSFSRSIAHTIDMKGDSISKYVFDLPDYKLYINGILTEEYGHYSDYINGDIDGDKDFDHYNWLYQAREAEIMFVTNQENLENILVIADSMSNPIRDVLASHFNRTLFINLDRYQGMYGEFEIQEYIDKYKIDKVLVMLTLDNYFPEGDMKYFNVE